MLATQINHHVQGGSLRKGCFVRLKKYQANEVKGKKILIILELDVLEELGEAEKIGEPQALESNAQDAPTKPAPIPSNGFYGDKKPQATPAQTKSLPSRNQAPSSSAHANIYPIEALSPYSHKWTIKARCTNKSDIKTWHNRNGEGKLFSVNLLDESGEIRATGFQEQCDTLYDLFQEGSVYYISSPCRVQIAKKQFSNVNNDYELTFDRDTVVEKAEEQDGVPQVRFNFTSIGDLQSVEKDTTIDVVGVLKDVGEVSQITSKTTSKPYDKRELTLVDNSGYSVRLTIWGNSATTFDVVPESVVAFKGVKVSDFGGRSLSLLSSGSMTVDPDIDEAHKLKGWYDAQGRTDTFASHANMAGATMGAAGGRSDPFKSIAQVKDEQLGMSDNTDYFSIKATIVYIRQENFNVAYPACLSEGCNKKVIETEPGEWRCERCDRTHPRPQYRYIMSANVSDHTGQLWLNLFDETGRMVVGMSADDLMDLKERDEKAAAEVLQEATCKTWNFKCRAKMDSFQEQQRVRYQVSSCSPLNFAVESAKLADLIKQYNLD
ncbi:putative replication protein a 70 kda dna-binding subunit [Phaeomoniella chlamydospora]|uniref:Replication protein A subunit n=1 Tax=Phaeomoniella chlamydospora TaxID=158046 RepID=A0A0G2E251_PHACM|nr:putative replication protein a 70 kda dna-binding subunit [Phaeomoniella chlamydospora]